MKKHFCSNHAAKKLRVSCLMLLFSMIAFMGYGSEAPPSISHEKGIAEEVQPAVSKTEQRKLRKKQRRKERKQRRFKRLFSKLKKKCHCKPKKQAMERGTDPPLKPKYDKETRLTVAGIFFVWLGTASLVWLFMMSATALIALKALAVVSLVIGDRLLCRYGSVCMLDALLELTSIFIYW